MGDCLNQARQRAGGEANRTAASHAAHAVGPATKVAKIAIKQETFAEDIAPGYGAGANFNTYRAFVNGELDDGLRGRKFVMPRGETQTIGMQAMIRPVADGAELVRRRGHVDDWEVLAKGSESAMFSEVKQLFPMRREVENFADPMSHRLMMTRKSEALEEDWEKFRSDPERSALVTAVIDKELADINAKVDAAKKSYADAVKRVRSAREIKEKQEQVELEKAKIAKRAPSEKELEAMQRTASYNKSRLEKATNEERNRRIAMDKLVERRNSVERSYDLFLADPYLGSWVFEGAGADKLTQMMRAGDQLPFWGVVGDRSSQKFDVHGSMVNAVEGLVGTNSAMLPGPNRKLPRGSVYGFKSSWWIGKFEGFHQKLRDHYTRFHNMGEGYTAGKVAHRMPVVHRLEKFWASKRGVDTDGRVMTWLQWNEQTSRDGFRYLETGQRSENPHVQESIEDAVALMRVYEEEGRRTGAFASISGRRQQIADIHARIENPPLGVYTDTDWEKGLREELGGLPSEGERRRETVAQRQRRRAEEEFRGVERQPEPQPEETLQERWSRLKGEQNALVRAGEQETEQYIRNGMEMRMIREEIDRRWFAAADLSDDTRKSMQQVLEVRSLETEQPGLGSIAHEELEVVDAKALRSWIQLRRTQIDSGRFTKPIEREMREDIRLARNNLRWRQKQTGIRSPEDRPQFSGGVEHLPPSRWKAGMEMKAAKLQEKTERATGLEGEWKPHLPKRWRDDLIEEDREGFEALLRKLYTEKDVIEGQTDELLEKRIASTIQTIRGENTNGDMAGVLQYDEQGRPVPLRPGALGRRRLDLPATFQAEVVGADGSTRTVEAIDFLDHDLSAVLQTYTVRVSGAIEMQKMFGDMTMERHLANLERVARAQGMPENLIEKQLNRIRDLRNMVLGIDAIHEDPTRLDSRILRGARNLNVSAFMGLSAQMQLIDLGNIAKVDGFRNMLQAMGLTFVHRATDLGRRIRKESAETFGLQSEITIMSRANYAVDAPGTVLTGETGAERFLRKTAHGIFYWNGAAWVTDNMRTMGGLDAQSNLLKLAKKAADGNISNQDVARLRRGGLDKDVAAKIWKHYDEHVPEESRIYRSSMFDGGLTLANTDQWLDPELVRIFASAIRSDMDSIVFAMNPGTKPKFTNNEYAKALLLYQTINMQMTQTLSLQILQRGMREMWQAMFAMVSLAFVVSSIRNPDYVERDWQDALYDAVMTSGVTGVFGASYEKFADISGTMPVFGRFGVENKPWAQGTDWSKISPITSQWWALQQAMFSPDAQADDAARALIYMFPYGNYVGVKEPFDLQGRARRAAEWGFEGLGWESAQ